MNRVRKYQDELHRKVFDKNALKNGLIKGECHSAKDIIKTMLETWEETRPIDDKINKCFRKE